MPIFFWKLLGVAALAVALLSIGFSVGHNKGYKAGFAIQQVTINHLTDQINAEHTATNNKISILEQAAAAEASKVHVTQIANLQAKTSIVTKYETHYIESSNKCGLDADTVKAINAIIAVDVDVDVPENVNLENVDPPTVSSSSVKILSLLEEGAIK